METLRRPERSAAGAQSKDLLPTELASVSRQGPSTTLRSTQGDGIGKAIRAARRHELGALRDIENRADEIFRRVAMPWVLAMTPADLDLLERARRAGHLWVATDNANRPIGFALLRVFDSKAWLHQLSVLPRYAGRGVGGALLEQVCARARQERHATLLLSTYLGVAWNAPFYIRRGFTVVPLADYTAAMRRERAHERQLGHPLWRRCLMRRDLAA